MGPQAVIELRNVSKRYGRTTAVAGATLSIAKGELLAIIGPSGAGKSTLLKLIAGEESPSTGDVFIEGRRVTDLSPSERGVAVVYQDYSLFPHLTVSENVSFPLDARAAKLFGSADRSSASSRAERVGSLLELVQLSAHERKRPDQLSGGEQQRAAIARAIALNPKLICFDEPFSALDSILRLKLRKQVQELKDSTQGAFLYVTHNVEEAFALADKILVMDRGEVAQLASPQDLYWRPANRMVGELTGDVFWLPIASVEQGDGGVTCITKGGARVGRVGLNVGPGDWIGVRPETVKIAADKGRVRGQINRITFEGSNTRYSVVLSGGEMVAFVAPSFTQASAALNGEVELDWDEERCFVTKS